MWASKVRDNGSFCKYVTTGSVKMKSRTYGLMNLDLATVTLFFHKKAELRRPNI